MDQASVSNLMFSALGGRVVHHLIYEVNTANLIGASESLFKEFALKTALYKLLSINAPKLDKIAPELFNQEVISELRSGQEVTIEFDTTCLIDIEYLIDLHGDDSYSEGSAKDQKDKSFTSDRNNEEKLKRLKKVRMLATFVRSETVENDEYISLKLIEKTESDEFMREEDNESQRSVQKEKMEMVEMDNNLIDKFSQDTKEAGGNNQAEDELRQLKDSRAMINERKNPKSIKILRRFTILLTLIMLAEVLYLRFQKASDTSYMLSAFERYLSLYKRNVALVDIGYYIRKYEMVSK